jgi:hypothetical protein
VTRYDWLLFLHVLSAFAIVGSVVVFTVVLLAARNGGEAAADALRLTPLARRLSDVGGTGTLVLGVWLAIDVDRYDLLDGWVLGALVLWVVAAAAGVRLGMTLQEGKGRGTSLYGAMTVAVAALLVVMIYKPGA